MLLLAFIHLSLVYSCNQFNLKPQTGLETINHQLVKEIAKSTTATLSMLANASSKVSGLEINERRNNRTDVSWNSAQKKDISHYRTKFTDNSGNERIEETSDTSKTLVRMDRSKPISVVAVNDRGIQGWDWNVFE